MLLQSSLQDHQRLLHEADNSSGRPWHVAAAVQPESACSPEDQFICGDKSELHLYDWLWTCCSVVDRHKSDQTRFLAAGNKLPEALCFTDSSYFLVNRPTCDQTADRRRVKNVPVFKTYVWHE